MKWFLKEFCGAAKGFDVIKKARLRAVAFLNQHSLSPGDVKITEGWLSEPSGVNKDGGIYEVCIFYQAERELPYQDPPELQST